MNQAPYNYCPVPDCVVHLDKQGRKSRAFFNRHFYEHHKDFTGDWRDRIFNIPSFSGPLQYSYWLYNTNLGEPRVTVIFEVEGCNLQGEGSVSGRYYSLNGTTNNADFTDHEIPRELKHMTLKQFWYLVASGALVYLDRQRDSFATTEPILNVGDKIAAQ